MLSLLGAIAWANSRTHRTLPHSFALGRSGEIGAWLIAGPFPNIGALQRHGTGFRTDYLGNESKSFAREDETIQKTRSEGEADPALVNPRSSGWRLGLANQDGILDLDRLLNGSKPAIAYCFVTLVSGKSQNAQILFGSDDGAKVWINGEQVFAKQIARGIKRDEDKIPFTLRKGSNTILFKIEQGDGGWGLLARVVNARGKMIPDLDEILDLAQSPNFKAMVQPGESWVRTTPGDQPLSVFDAVDFDHALLNVRRWVSRFKNYPESNVHASQRIDQVLRRTTSSAAFGASILSRYLSQGSRQLDSILQRARAPFLMNAQLDQPQFAVQASNEDFVKVMPQGRYFTHADGRPFTPIGYNHNPDWPKFEEANPDQDNPRPEVTEAYMAHLKAFGVNVLRLMVETPPSGNLEDPIGTFRPEHLVWLDRVFLAARHNGIKLIVTPWDTFWMNLRSETSTYYPGKGGLIAKPIDFITDPRLRSQQKRRLKYLIDRWGNSGTVFSWELLNEADLWWNATPEQLTDWVTDMSHFVREYEYKKWGRNHLVSVSFATAMPHGPLMELALNSPLLDYATTHLYIGPSRAPTEPIGPADAIKQGVSYNLSEIRDTRPFMDTENGPIDHWIQDPKLDEDVFHNMIWAHLASGAAGSGFRWPYRQPHILTEGMLLHLKQMSKFVSEIPWAQLAGNRVPIKVEINAGEAVSGFGTLRAAIVWTFGKGPLTFQWPQGPAKLQCREFDTLSGEWTDPRSLVPHEGNFTIEGRSKTSRAFILTAFN